jgi:hypothetical protein
MMKAVSFTEKHAALEKMEAFSHMKFKSLWRS